MDAAGAGLPAGAKMAVVSGDPGKAGAFVIRAKFPANYTVPPHHHPTDEVVRVMGAGTLTYGMGDKVSANSGSLTKGYHVTMAAGMNHWVTTTDPVEIQVSGTGPFRSSTSIRRTIRGRSDRARVIPDLIRDPGDANRRRALHPGAAAVTPRPYRFAAGRSG